LNEARAGGISFRMYKSASEFQTKYIGFAFSQIQLFVLEQNLLYGRTAHEMRSPSVASELAPRVFTYFTI
jgi:hypothetical protein